MTDATIDISSEAVERAIGALARKFEADNDIALYHAEQMLRALRAALDEREAAAARLRQWLLDEHCYVVDQWDAGYDAAIRATLLQLGATHD